MNITPLSAIADMADGLPVICVEGTVKYAGKISKGRSDSGTDWSRQFFVLAQNGAEVGCTLWEAAGNEVKKGEQLRIENTQNKKGQWSAITKSSYEKEGKMNHTLEIRAEQAKIKPLSGGDEKTQPVHAASSPSQTMAGQHEYGPRVDLTQIDQRDIPPAGVNEARQHIMQAANLYVLCIGAVENYIAKHLPKIAQTSEQFQAAVGTLFIEASRTGLVAKMPAKPVNVGNEKVERPPIKQEEIIGIGDPSEYGDEAPF